MDVLSWTQVDLCVTPKNKHTKTSSKPWWVQVVLILYTSRIWELSNVSVFQIILQFFVCAGGGAKKELVRVESP